MQTPGLSPETVAAAQHPRYLNRELSWLEFNARVLEEAFDTANPLLERLNFLAISAANLDEFYMVRVAGLKDMQARGMPLEAPDRLPHGDEIALINIRTNTIVERQNLAWRQLREEMAAAGIAIVSPESLSAKDMEWLAPYFQDNIFPVLTPIAIDPAHPFPFIPSLGMAMIVDLVGRAGSQSYTAVIPLPTALPRFISIPGKNLRFVMLEDMIRHFIDALFAGMQVEAHAVFRLVRDSELDVDDGAEDFFQQFERAVKERRYGSVIRVRFQGPAPEHLVRFVVDQLKVPQEDVVVKEGMIGLRQLSEIVDAGPQEMKFPPFVARHPERIDDYDGDCFAAIAAKDIVIHHPFETFDVVVKFLRQAANDPAVVSVKQTLYRTTKDSPIVKALIEAAENGKSVTALIELKARFDEEANIRFARDLERAGVQVAYGFVKLKTHAKVTLITRKEHGKLVSYAHFGTGNYHPGNARLYTDLSFFTMDADLCRDAAYLFNFVTGYAAPRTFRKLVVAPKSLRLALLSLIQQERENARAGKPSGIWAKMNSLVDTEIIEALYAASNDGVKIELVVRGICCLRSGVKGMSENIRVKSVIGRFLEHSRIFCFANGAAMPSREAKVFISSADWMPRNLDWRVELMVPIENPTVHAQVLDQIMVANLKDETNSWEMEPDGSYRSLQNKAGGFSAHAYFLENPSLSGRGTALKRIKSKQML